MTVDELILLVQAILGLILVGLLIARRVTASLTFFLVYLIFSVVSAATGLALATQRPSAYFYYAFAAYILDAALYLLVILELAGSVLAFNRKDRLRRLIALPLFAFASLLLWPLAHWTTPFSMDFGSQIFSEVLHATSTVEVAAILALLAWSMLLRLHWPESELRVLTGIAVWPIVGFAILILHSMGVFGRQYRWLDLLAPVSAIAATLYWIHYFWIVLPATRLVATAWKHGADRQPNLSSGRHG